MRELIEAEQALQQKVNEKTKWLQDSYEYQSLKEQSKQVLDSILRATLLIFDSHLALSNLFERINMNLFPGGRVHCLFL